MISFVSGTLSEITEGQIIVECGGIGYEINVPLSVLSELPRIGEEVKIHTYFRVSEDAMNLYGFMSRNDRDMFTQLIGVSGIGPKGALAILSALSPDELRMAIMAGDDKAIARAQGIGAKTAQRVIIDLRDKVSIGDLMDSGKASKIGAGDYAQDTGVLAEVAQALTSLGYSSSDAMRAVRSVDYEEGMDAETLLKLTLKKMV